MVSYPNIVSAFVSGNEGLVGSKSRHLRTKEQQTMRWCGMLQRKKRGWNSLGVNWTRPSSVLTYPIKCCCFFAYMRHTSFSHVSYCIIFPQGCRGDPISTPSTSFFCFQSMSIVENQMKGNIFLFPLPFLGSVLHFITFPPVVELYNSYC